MAALTPTWTFLDGEWLEGNPLVAGPRTHAFWMGSSVFDGARAFEGVTPDLDLHLARVNRSAEALMLRPSMSVGAMAELVADGLAKFPAGTPIYIRPMYWADEEGPGAVTCDPASTRFLLCMHEAAMGRPENGIRIGVSTFRRPSMETMPTNAKAGCLYPNNARAQVEARGRGFDNALVLDMLGNVAELATANVFIVRDGVVATPAENGTFLAGITRNRIIERLRSAGRRVETATLSVRDVMEADEVFTTGNYSKVMPITKVEDRVLQPGPLFRQARELYWEFAHG